MLTAACALSLFGLPISMGFATKALVLSTLASNGCEVIAFTAMIAKILASLYYLRIVRSMYTAKGTAFMQMFTSGLAGSTAHICAVAVLWL